MKPWILSAALACAVTTASCAGLPAANFPAAPPRLEMPTAATSPCALYVLPEKPTEADLDIGFASRGANLVACDAARRLAVQTLVAEHELQDRYAAAQRPRRGWFHFPP